MGKGALRGGFKDFKEEVTSGWPRKMSRILSSKGPGVKKDTGSSKGVFLGSSYSLKQERRVGSVRRAWSASPSQKMTGGWRQALCSTGLCLESPGLSECPSAPGLRESEALAQGYKACLQ